MIATTDERKLDQLVASDSRRLFVISVRESAPGLFVAQVNGRELKLPLGLPSLYDARKVAVELAIKELAAAAKELIDRYFD